MFCHDCNSSPCKAFLYKEGLQAEFNSLSSLLAPSHKRNHLYRKFVVGEHGTLGRHVRVRVPECVIKFIRELCPEPSGTYTGHRDVDSEGEEEVGNDESFEGVLPQGNLGTINFDGGMKIKVCVSFENNVYPISHVRKFINESNVLVGLLLLLAMTSLMQQLCVTLRHLGMKFSFTVRTKSKR